MLLRREKKQTVRFFGSIVLTFDSMSQADRNAPKRYKVVVVGDPGVGKTCLIHRISMDYFKDGQKSTTEPCLDVVTLDDNTTFELWDTAGQEQYRSLCTQYFRNSQAALVCHSVVDQESLAHVDSWVACVRDKLPEVPIWLVSTKCDILDGTEKCIEDARAKADRLGLVCVIETSAKTGQNTHELLAFLSDHLMNNSQKPKEEPKLDLAKPSRNKKCC